MSRTLTRVALIGAAVAVNFVPGVGQAISATVLGATGSLTAGLAATTAATIVGAVEAGLALAATAVTVAGIQAGASLLGLGPKLPRPETSETAVKTPIPPRVFAYGRRRLFGYYALYETAENGTAVDVYVFHDGRMDGIERYYLNDDQVTLTGNVVNAGEDGRYRDGAVSVFMNLGLPTETAFASIVSLLPGIWTTEHRGDGCVTGAMTAKAVKDKVFLETYPNGAPVLSIAGRWLRVYDWRDPGQDIEDESTWQWSENGVLQLAHFMMTRERLNEPEPLSIADWFVQRIEPELSYWTDAADDCDLAMPLAAGGTEARYRSSVAYKATDGFKAVKDEILSTFDGWLATTGTGAFRVRSGRYYTPTVSIGPDEIVSFAYRDGVAEEDAVDTLVVSYISADHDFNTVDTDPWVVAEGERTQPFTPQVPSHSQARRLAKRQAARVMASVKGSLTTNVAGRAIRGERFIDLDLQDDDGTVFYQGPAEVIALTRNFDTGGVTIDWIAADPDIDDWDPATEEGSPAPLGDRVEQTALEAPTIVTAEAIFDSDSADSLTGARIAIIGTGPDRDDLTWFTRWRVGTDPWVEETAEDTDPASPVALLTGFVPVGVDVEVQIAYEVGDGRRSPWSL